MNQKRLFARLERERKSGISPIIATLLLILIAIAAGVVVYAYVIGFVGGSTTGGGSQSIISVDNFCASATTNCNTKAYSVVVRNVGSTTIATGTAQLYFTDITASTTGQASCSISAAVPPGSSYTCNQSWPSGFSPASGDSLTVKIVNPDGGATTSSGKAIP